MIGPDAGYEKYRNIVLPRDVGSRAQPTNRTIAEIGNPKPLNFHEARRADIKRRNEVHDVTASREDG